VAESAALSGRCIRTAATLAMVGKQRQFVPGAIAAMAQA
jgi:hypothetical protein